MTKSGKQNPLHGVTLEAILTRLEQRYGFEKLGRRINIKCFTTNPSIKSSLTFLRKTEWARKKVEDLYIRTKWSKPTPASIWAASPIVKKSRSSEEK